MLGNRRMSKLPEARRLVDVDGRHKAGHDGFGMNAALMD